MLARPAWRGTFAFNHTAGGWDFNVRATYTGPQDLAKFYGYADTPRYNLDGTAKPARSPSFWVADLYGSYQWSNRVSTYAGINNLFNNQQAKKDSFLWLDSEGAIDVTHVWGPSLRTCANEVSP
jgi:outer membrane receptor for ferrienterochelin and colicins